MVSLNWERLSPHGQAILRQIAIPISVGYSEAEVASELGTSTRWVSNRLVELREELREVGRD
jgi:DNA-directed RNA polymerase specialized sigma24 family protein